MYTPYFVFPSPNYGYLHCFYLSAIANNAAIKIGITGTSLVAEWLGVRLPMQETRFGALVREDPTCLRAAKPVHHNY